MNTLTVGLIGTESKTWIAGVNYLSSFLYANSLISQSQQQTFHLFLYKHFSDEADYKNVNQYAKSVNVFDFCYGVILASLRLLMQTFRVKWLHRGSQHNIDNNLPTLLLDTKCQIVFPANNLLTNGPSSIKTISWIPDFQYKYFPEYFPNPARQNYQTRRILRLSDLVIVSNEFSKKDVQKFFPKYSHKIRVMPFTMWLGPEWEPLDYKTAIQKHHLPRKYLIYSSQFWAHKNHRLLFEAITTVKKRGYTDIRLVCTGFTHDYRNPSYVKDLYSYIENHKLQENIQILGLLPRHEQIQLFRGAAAVIQPSLFEGYSALLDEAQSLGKEVFVSDIPMHREQQTEKFVFFNPYDSLDLADKLENGWQSLNPGPDLKAEQLALKNYYLRLAAFGNHFKEICHSII